MFKVALFLFLLSPFSYAQEAKVSVKVALFPAGSFEAKSSSVYGRGVKKRDTYFANEIKVPISTIKTGMSLRDKHLQEKLNAKSYPSIIVSGAIAKDGKGKCGIEIAGAHKVIDFTYKELSKGWAEATFNLNLKDFNIYGISYMGVGVEDEVIVTAIIPYD